MVQLTVSQIEHQGGGGVSGSNPAFSVSFFFFFFIISFHSYMYRILLIYFFSLSCLAVSPLQANCVGRWYHSVPGRPVSLDNGRARAYCACSRSEWGSSDIFFFCRLSFFFSSSLCLGWMDGWLFNRISVISGRWVGDGWLCAMEISFTIQKILASSGARIRDHQISRPAPTSPCYRNSCLCEMARYRPKYCLTNQMFQCSL